MDEVCFEEFAREAFQEGWAAHGNLHLSLEAFTNRLKNVFEKYGNLPSEQGRLSRVSSNQIYAADLYLTAACATRAERAWVRFCQLYRTYLDEMSLYLERDKASAKELAENVFTDLYLPDRTGQSRISSYDGRSALTTWLRVVLSNRAFNERCRKCNYHEPFDPMRDLVDRRALTRLENRLTARRYAPMIKNAMISSCRTLTDSERTMLLWRYEQNLRLGEIAKVMGIHQSTVTRQLERAMKRIRSHVTSLLKTEYKLSDAAIQECLQILPEHLSNSISVLSFLNVSRSVAHPCAEATQP